MLQRHHEFFEFVGLSGIDVATIIRIVRRCRSFTSPTLRRRLRRLRWNTTLLYPLVHLSTCAVGCTHTLNARVTHLRDPRSPTPTLSPIHTKAKCKLVIRQSPYSSQSDGRHKQGNLVMLQAGNLVRRKFECSVAMQFGKAVTPQATADTH